MNGQARMHRVFLVLMLAVAFVGCSQTQDGVATKADGAGETGLTQAADVTSEGKRTDPWEYAPFDAADYPDSWLFLIENVKVTRKSIVSARFTLKNLSDGIIFADRSALERDAAWGLTLWRCDIPGSFCCVFADSSIERNWGVEGVRIQPGEEISLDFQFSDDPLWGYQLVHEPEGGIEDWSNVPPAVLEPGEYIVDSQMLVEFSTEKDKYAMMRRVNLMSGNKVWVDVE